MGNTVSRVRYEPPPSSLIFDMEYQTTALTEMRKQLLASEAIELRTRLERKILQVLGLPAIPSAESLTIHPFISFDETGDCHVTFLYDHPPFTFWSAYLRQMFSPQYLCLQKEVYSLINCVNDMPSAAAARTPGISSAGGHKVLMTQQMDLEFSESSDEDGDEELMYEFESPRRRSTPLPPGVSHNGSVFVTTPAVTTPVQPPVTLPSQLLYLGSMTATADVEVTVDDIQLRSLSLQNQIRGEKYNIVIPHSDCKVFYFSGADSSHADKAVFVFIKMQHKPAKDLMNKLSVHFAHRSSYRLDPKDPDEKFSYVAFKSSRNPEIMKALRYRLRAFPADEWERERAVALYNSIREANEELVPLFASPIPKSQSTGKKIVPAAKASTATKSKAKTPKKRAGSLPVAVVAAGSTAKKRGRPPKVKPQTEPAGGDVTLPPVSKTVVTPATRKSPRLNRNICNKHKN